MEKLDVLALKVKTNRQEQPCQVKQQNWKKTKPLSKAIQMADQRQQEHYIHYIQETLRASVPFQDFPPMEGEGEREQMVPGEWNGQRTHGWSPLQELDEWGKRRSPKGQRH